MVIPIKDAQDVYAEWVQEIRVFEAELTNKGFKIEKRDEFELGGEWSISDDKGTIVEFMWNVPHMLALHIDGEGIVSEDYIKDSSVWREVVNYCMMRIIQHF